MRMQNSWYPVLMLLGLSALGLVLVKAGSSESAQGVAEHSPSAGLNGFTPAHRGAIEAVKEFFGYRPAPQQPIAYTHKLHLANGLQCVNCHTGVDTGPDARVPGVRFCMTCHQVIATDKPEIKKMAAYLARGEEIPWQRVYGYYPSAHVKFNHSPHIRAGVDCQSCHGDMTKQTVAVRSVDLTMGFCLDCHIQKKASTDCVVCHF